MSGIVSFDVLTVACESPSQVPSIRLTTRCTRERTSLHSYPPMVILRDFIHPLSRLLIRYISPLRGHLGHCSTFLDLDPSRLAAVAAISPDDDI